MNTFIDLYKYLQTIYEEPSIIPFLQEKWQGKDKQESLLRLFGGLGLICKLNKFPYFLTTYIFENSF